MLHVFTLMFCKPESSWEPFNLEIGPGSSNIPPEVLRRCNGKQTPITPHRQRLLVAASKDSKREIKGKGKGAGKGEGKDVNGVGPQKKAKKPSTKKKPATAKREQSTYGDAKAAYMKRPLAQRDCQFNLAVLF